MLYGPAVEETTMTRRDYLLLSKALREARQSTPVPCEQDGIDRAARQISYAIGDLREGFDAKRFLSDSGAK